MGSTVTKWLKKFRSSCKDLDKLAKLGRPKSVDSKAVHQKSGEKYKESIRHLDISLSSVVRHLQDLGKTIKRFQNLPLIVKV